MKLIFTFSIIYLVATITNAQTLPRLSAQSEYSLTPLFPEDSTSYQFTGTNGGDLTHILKYTTSTTYLYNTAGHVRRNASLIQHTFDASDNITGTLEQQYDTVKQNWVNYFKTTSGYDTNNNDTSILLQNWDTSASSWVNAFHSTYTYINNLETSYIFQMWDTTSNQWLNIAYYVYNYNNNNKVQSYIYKEWNNITLLWDTAAGAFHHYDNNGNDTSVVSENYDVDTKQWTNSQAFHNTFDSRGNEITSVQLDWYAFWDSTYKFYYAYDNQSNDTAITEQMYSAGAWNNYSKVISTYNGFNQATSVELMYPDSLIFIPYLIDYYYYESSTGVRYIPGNNSNLQLYPNPGSNYVHISLTLESAQTILLSLYDLQGREIWNADMGMGTRAEATVPLNNLTNGVYLLKLNTGETTEERKIVVAR